MPGFTDLVNLILALDASDQRKASQRISMRQLELEEERNKRESDALPFARLGEFNNIVQQTERPEQLNSVAAYYSGKTGIPVATLMQMAGANAPGVPQLQAGVMQDFINAKKGTPAYDDYASTLAYNVGTGAGPGSAAKEGATARTIGGNRQIADVAGMIGATGMPPSAFARENALALQVTPQDWNRAFRISQGMETSAGEQQSAQLAREGQTLQGKIAGGQLELGRAGLKSEDEYRRAQTDVAYRAAAAKGATPDAIANLQKMMLNSVEFLTKNSTTTDSQRFQMFFIRDQFDSLYGKGMFDKTFGGDGKNQIDYTSPGLGARFKRFWGMD